jgi:hypothetical protein
LKQDYSSDNHFARGKGGSLQEKREKVLDRNNGKSRHKMQKIKKTIRIIRIMGAKITPTSQCQELLAQH